MSSSNNYFRVKLGYGKNDFISLSSVEDAEKAFHAFLTDSKVVFSDGQMCRGKDIVTITEDWHREMGYNPTHVLDDLDWQDIREKKIDQKYVGVLAGAKEKIQYELSNNSTTARLGS